jgi:hypothetical protein
MPNGLVPICINLGKCDDFGMWCDTSFLGDNALIYDNQTDYSCLQDAFINKGVEHAAILTPDLVMNKYWKEVAQKYSHVLSDDFKYGLMSIEGVIGNVIGERDDYPFLVEIDNYNIRGCVMRKKWYVRNLANQIRTKCDDIVGSSLGQNKNGYNLKMFALKQPVAMSRAALGNDQNKINEFIGKDFYDLKMNYGFDKIPENMHITEEEGISFLVPTYKRPENVRAFATLVDKCAKYKKNIEIVYGTHEDDKDTIEAIEKVNSELEISVRCEIIDKYEDGKPHLCFFWNQIYPKAKYDIVGFYGDDVEFDCQEWDKYVFWEFRKNKHVMVYGDDSHGGEDFATLFFTHKETHKAFGYYMYPKLRRYFMDVLWDQVYRNAQRRVFYKQIKVIHRSGALEPSRIDEIWKAMDVFVNSDAVLWKSKEYECEVKRCTKILINLKDKVTCFYNALHLGDCVFHVHFMRKFIECNEGLVRLYCHKEYIPELEKHVGKENEKRIFLLDIENKPDSAINCWLGVDEWFWKQSDNPVFNEIYPRFYQMLADKYGFINPIKTKMDMLSDHPFCKDWICGGKWDYLVVNSFPKSGQLSYDRMNRAVFDEIIKRLIREGNKVITTLKVEGVPCTADDHMNLLQIGSVAVAAKNIIFIHTAPHIHAINKWSLENCKRFICISEFGHTYTYNDKFKNVKSFKELERELWK